ncbi:MAG: bifunctional DNA-formamidopyrimidine glycosylase/DNA-(apurinic or apyrimidinic site) lyase [Microthrixaceae bacterium]
MPELPEVETIRRQLDPVLRDVVLVEAWAFPSAKFHDAPLAVGSRLAGVRRRGKYLLVDLAPTRRGDDARELIVHLGMTGRLAVDGDGDAPRHLRAWWRLDDGRTLWFDDVRRFGRIAVVDRGVHTSLPTLAALGPEPFDEAFTPELLRTRVNASRRALKTQLLSQRVVAGVGNIYADEALWLAGVHPASRHLTRAQALALRDAVRLVLDHGITHGGTTLRNYRDAEGGSGSHQRHLECYGRAGEPCGRCGSELRRSVIDARSTTHCPTCQRR